jgi:hypothetical protein
MSLSSPRRQRSTPSCTCQSCCRYCPVLTLPRSGPQSGYRTRGFDSMESCRSCPQRLDDWISPSSKRWPGFTPSCTCRSRCRSCPVLTSPRSGPQSEYCTRGFDSMESCRSCPCRLDDWMSPSLQRWPRSTPSWTCRSRCRSCPRRVVALSQGIALGESTQWSL